MKWLEKIFGWKEVQTELMVKPIKLRFGDISSWLKGETADFFKILGSGISKSYEEIKELRKQLQTGIASLEKAEADKEADPGLRKTVLDNRASLITKLQRFVKNTEIPDKEPGAALNFYGLLNEEVDQFFASSAKNLYFVNILFDTRYITKNIRALNSMATESKKAIERDKIRDIATIENKIEEVKNLLTNQKETEEKIKQCVLKSENLSKEKKEIQEAIDELKNSEEAAQLKQFQTEQEEISMKIARDGDEISQLLSPLGKALKKYERFTTLNKQESKILEMYINSPMKAVFADEGLKVLAKILEDMQKLIESDKIELKDKQKSKTIIQIKNMRDKTRLKEMLGNYRELNEEKESVQNKIDAARIGQDMIDFEKKLASVEENLESAQREMRQSETSKSNIIQIIPEKIKELEESLRKISGKEIGVELP